MDSGLRNETPPCRRSKLISQLSSLHSLCPYPHHSYSNPIHSKEKELAGASEEGADLEARRRHLREQRERILALREKQRQDKLDKYLAEKRASQSEKGRMAGGASDETEAGEGDAGAADAPADKGKGAAAMRKALASRIRREVRLGKGKGN